VVEVKPVNDGAGQPAPRKMLQPPRTTGDLHPPSGSGVDVTGGYAWSMTESMQYPLPPSSASPDNLTKIYDSEAVGVCVGHDLIPFNLHKRPRNAGHSVQRVELVLSRTVFRAAAVHLFSSSFGLIMRPSLRNPRDESSSLLMPAQIVALRFFFYGPYSAPA